MNSSTDNPLWTLARKISQAAAERFVIELLNLDVHDEAAQRRFCSDKYFADMIPVISGGITENDRNIDQLLTEQGANRLWILRESLASAWRMPTPWDREVALLHPLYILLHDFHQSHSPNPSSPGWRPLKKQTTAAAKLIGVLLKIQHSADRFGFCGNPECKTPYFIAGRNTQKFCSEPCAAPAQRAHKRDWWAKHGAARRKRKGRK